MKNYLSANLSFLRELKGLSLSDVAERVSKGKSTLSNWEKGVSEPSISDLLELSTFFKVPVGELIGENLSNKPPDYLQQVLKIDYFNKIDSETANTLRDIAEYLKGISSEINSIVTKINSEVKSN